MTTKIFSSAFAVIFSAFLAVSGANAQELKPAVAVPFNNDITVDLGVGLWGIPVPWDFDGDGLKDLLVTCPDVPYKGTYFFKNIGTKSDPLFAKAVKINDKSHKNLRFSEADGKMFLLTPDEEQVDFFNDPFKKKTKIEYEGDVLGATYKRNRSNMWNKVDWDNDGDLDIVVGIDTWDDYGWDNAFNEKGEWINGPLHGYLFLLENVNGKYINRGEIKAGGKMIDTFGAPCPCIADFDGDGDLDIICGEFRDGLTWYENIGTRSKPRFKAGRQIVNADGDIRFHIEMIVPVPTDFDQDGLVDLVVSDEDGSVAFVRNTGRVKNHMPVFETPVKFRQKADLLKFGALNTPCSYDWNADGREDIICGNSAGDICFIENLGGGASPVWAEPKLMKVDGKPLRILAGVNGSIQGPAECKWGYTVLSVADWDADGKADIIINSIWGKIQWFKNLGSEDGLEFAPAQDITVAWEGAAPKPAWNWWNPAPGTLTSQWRTTPVATDWNKDGLCDLVMLDHEGYLAYFERFKDESGALTLKPGKRIFHCTNGSVYQNGKGMIDKTPGILRLNDRIAGQSGRRKICLVDWDKDGLQDLIIDARNAAWFRCVRIDKKTGEVYFEYKGDLASTRLEGHTTCPTPVDWNGDNIPDLLVGAEDGHFYYIENEMTAYDDRVKLYGEGVMPRDEKLLPSGYVTGVIEPEILVYKPQNPNGQAVLVVPGGGYASWCVTFEGYKTANWLNSKGVTAFILKYRMPQGRPETVLEDGEKAMRFIRENASRYGIDPHQVGIIGYSAGGHFCSTLLTKYTSAVTRPDFGVLIYPVVEMGENTHSGTRDGLLGDRKNDVVLQDYWTASKNIPSGMPPVMIISTEDDKGVPVANSKNFYEALQAAGVTSELHIYPEGGHGFWFRNRYKYMKETLDNFENWLNKMSNRWETLPLSPATDRKQLEEQIAANPEEWEAAAKFLQENDLTTLALGRHEITSNGTYANVQEYDTRAKGKFEAHKKYIDVQVVVSGEEDIIVAPVESAQCLSDKYDEASDIMFWSRAKGAKAVFADPSNWVVLFPSEAHKPCMTRGTKPASVRKIVVKIPFSKK